MKNVVKFLFVFVYVIFVAVTILLYTPPTLVDFIATLVVPAICLTAIYWINIKAGRGFIEMIRNGRKR